MNRQPRNQSLLARLSETNPFRKELAPRLFEIQNTFQREIEAIAQDGRLSPQGKRDKAKEHVQKALGVLDGLQQPLAAYREETERMRAAVKKQTYDRADSYAQRNRHKMLD